mmetsp:Transcript_34516/g.59715  ORF Transcript_34516/g.59715 Transcript_34516/m.59715 type:complete len:80 (+) Transcript_34516:163-402(+)
MARRAFLRACFWCSGRFKGIAIGKPAFSNAWSTSDAAASSEEDEVQPICCGDLFCVQELIAGIGMGGLGSLVHHQVVDW